MNCENNWNPCNSRSLEWKVANHVSSPQHLQHYRMHATLGSPALPAVLEQLSSAQVMRAALHKVPLSFSL